MRRCDHAIDSLGDFRYAYCKHRAMWHIQWFGARFTPAECRTHCRVLANVAQCVTRVLCSSVAHLLLPESCCSKTVSTDEHRHHEQAL